VTLGVPFIPWEGMAEVRELTDDIVAGGGWTNGADEEEVGP